MKSLLTLMAFCLFAMNGIGQNEIVLNFNHLLGLDNYTDEYEVMVDGDYEILYERCEYYLSEFSIVHDGGQTTDLEDVYLLVNANNNDNYSLGSYDIDEVESITFGIGVDSDANFLDPAIYPDDHPLAYQEPSMHWGWSSGYRFWCMEGSTGPNLLYNVEVHALGEDNFGFVSLNFDDAMAQSGTITLDIDADYTRLLDNLNVSSGIIMHALGGPVVLEFLYNARTFVFSTDAALDIQESSNDDLIQVYPIPMTSNELNIDALGTFSLSKIEIHDVSGKLVFESKMNSAKEKIDLSHLSTGVYQMNLLDNKGEVIQKRILK